MVQGLPNYSKIILYIILGLKIIKKKFIQTYVTSVNFKVHTSVRKSFVIALKLAKTFTLVLVFLVNYTDTKFFGGYFLWECVNLFGKLPIKSNKTSLEAVKLAVFEKMYKRTENLSKNNPIPLLNDHFFYSSCVSCILFISWKISDCMTQ